VSVVSQCVQTHNTHMLRLVDELVTAGANACAVSKEDITVDGIVLPSGTSALHLAMQLGVCTQSLLDSLRPACGHLPAALRTWAADASRRSAPSHAAPPVRVTPFCVALIAKGQLGRTHRLGNATALAWIKNALGDEGFAALCAEPCFVQFEGDYPLFDDVLWPLHIARSPAIVELLIRAAQIPTPSAYEAPLLSS